MFIVYMYTHINRKCTEKGYLEQSVLVEFSKAGHLAKSKTADSIGKLWRSTYSVDTGGIYPSFNLMYV